MPGTEFVAGGALHRTRDLCAYDQFRLLRTIGPALPALTTMDAGLTLGADFDAAAAALAPLEYATDEDIAATFAACAAACERQDDDGTWAPASKAMPLGELMRVVMSVVAANFTVYFTMSHPEFRATTGQTANFEPVTMPDGEDWLWRPVDAGMLSMMAAYDGTHRIEHFAKANDILAVRVENEARAHKAATKG